MTGMSRRAFLLGSALAGTVALGACGWFGPSGVPVAASDPVVGDVEAKRHRAGQRIVDARLSPRPVEVDLGGIVVATWAYGPTVPGPVLRAGAGDLPADPRPVELDRRVLLPADLTPAPASRLTDRGHDHYLSVDLGGGMMPYRWTLNGQAPPDTTPLEVSRDQRDSTPTIPAGGPFTATTPTTWRPE